MKTSINDEYLRGAKSLWKPKQRQTFNGVRYAERKDKQFVSIPTVYKHYIAQGYVLADDRRKRGE